jgi:hypothetical protein
MQKYTRNIPPYFVCLVTFVGGLCFFSSIAADSKKSLIDFLIANYVGLVLGGIQLLVWVLFEIIRFQIVKPRPKKISIAYWYIFFIPFFLVQLQFLNIHDRNMYLSYTMIGLFLIAVVLLLVLIFLQICARRILYWNDLVEDWNKQDILLVKCREIPNRVILFNTATAKEEYCLYTTRRRETLGEVALSKRKYLAVEKVASFQGRGVSIIHPNGKELRFIADASRPVWSRDGAYLAYTLGTGTEPLPLYLCDKEGDEQRYLGVQSSGAPVWDVYSEWLVYGRDAKIYKVNAFTCEEVELMGEVSPDWKRLTSNANDN